MEGNATSSKVTSFSIDDILTRRREAISRGLVQEEEGMKGTTLTGSPGDGAASPPGGARGRGGSCPPSPAAPVAPAAPAAASPRTGPGSPQPPPPHDRFRHQNSAIGLRDVSPAGHDAKRFVEGHAPHHAALPTPPYFPYYPAGAMIQGPPGSGSLFVQTSYGMLPTSTHPHQRSLHPSAAGVGVIPTHTHLPFHPAAGGGGGFARAPPAPPPRVGGAPPSPAASLHSAGVGSPHSPASSSADYPGPYPRESTPGYADSTHVPPQPQPLRFNPDLDNTHSTKNTSRTIPSSDHEDSHSPAKIDPRSPSPTAPHRETGRDSPSDPRRTGTDPNWTGSDLRDDDADDEDVLVDVVNSEDEMELEDGESEGDGEGEDGGCGEESGDARSTCSSSGREEPRSGGGGGDDATTPHSGKTGTVKIAAVIFVRKILLDQRARTKTSSWGQCAFG